MRESFPEEAASPRSLEGQTLLTRCRKAPPKPTKPQMPKHGGFSGRNCKHLSMPGAQGSHRGVAEMKLENRGQSLEWFAKTTEVSVTSKTELGTLCQYKFFKNA